MRAYTEWAVANLEERLTTWNADGCYSFSIEGVLSCLSVARRRGGAWTIKKCVFLPEFSITSSKSCQLHLDIIFGFEGCVNANLSSLVPFIENLGSDLFVAAFLTIMYDNLYPTDKIEPAIEQPALQEVYRLLLATNLGIVDRRDGSQIPLAHAFNVARVIDNCLAFDLEESARRIYNQLIINVRDCSHDSKFLSTFLKEMHEFLPARQNVDKELFGNVASAILEKVINQRYQPRPTKPKGWPMKKKGCGCQHCDRLDRFLTAPAQRSARFSLDQQARKHLDDRLRYYGGRAYGSSYDGYPLYAFDTDKSTRPCYTLVITKLRPEFDQDLKEWQTDFKALEDDLAGLRRPFMRRVLGERYEDLVELRALKKSHELAEMTDAAASNTAPPTGFLKERSNSPGSTLAVPGAGAKRKAEEDLPSMRTAKKKQQAVVIELSD